MNSGFVKISTGLLIFSLVFVWIFVGWPQVWQNPPIPPQIQRVLAVQTGAPISDISTGSWTDEGSLDNDGSLWTSLDEVSQDGDTSYASGTVGAATFEVKLGSLTDPATSTSHIVHVFGEGVGSGAGEKVDLYLYEATILRVTVATKWTPGRSAYADVNYTLTGAEADAITDYTDLRVRVAMNTIGSGEFFKVTQIYMEVPNVPSPTTTLGPGTNPGDATIGPSGAATEVDSFTFQTSASTDIITSVTTTLAVNTTSSIAEVAITSDNGATVYGSSTNPTANSFTITLNQNTFTASTTETQLKIRITPKSHANMPVPPGQTFTVTSTITGWAGTNTQAGSDATSSVLTIDNLSPNGAVDTSGSAGNTQVTLNWTTSDSSDFSRSVVLRWASSTPGSEVPAEGTDYSVDNTIVSSTVACVRTADASSTAVSGTDGAGTGGCSSTALTNGQAYSYKVFQKDSNGNYDVGVTFIGSPFTPQASTISCATNITSTAFGTLDSGLVTTSTQNASTTMSCSGTSLGCTLYINDTGTTTLGGGLWNSTSSVLIESPNAAFAATSTLQAGTEGYGIRAATTTVGSGVTLTLAQRYNVQVWLSGSPQDVGGLATTTLTLASSTADVTNREVVVTHKAAIAGTTPIGTYDDAITYSCILN